MTTVTLGMVHLGLGLSVDLVGIVLVLRFQRSFPTVDLFDDGTGGCSPDKGLGVSIVLFEGHCHVKRSDFDRVFSVACRDANHLLHTPSIST